MIVTMLQGEVPEERSGRLVGSFEEVCRNLPDSIQETFLLRETGGDRWQVLTVWKSQEALDTYRTSVEVPEGIVMFRSAGVEPDLGRFRVEGHADHT